MSMEVFLNIYDIIKILISDWTVDNSRFIASIEYLLVLNYIIQENNEKAFRCFVFIRTLICFCFQRDSN